MSKLFHYLPESLRRELPLQRNILLRRPGALTPDEIDRRQTAISQALVIQVRSAYSSMKAVLIPIAGQGTNHGGRAYVLVLQEKTGAFCHVRHISHHQKWNMR